MKRIFNIATVAALGFAAASCSLFQIDNYDAPKETITGRVIDRDGNPVLTDQGSEGTRVRLIETSWEGNVTPFDFWCRNDGTFTNTKIFEADYNIRVDGAFVPIVKETSDGVMIEDNSWNGHVKGVQKIDFVVDPFLKVEIVDIPQAAAGQITAKVKVTRGISREDFKAAVEPMGGFEESMANITDVQLFVSYSSSVGYRSRDDRWSGKKEFSGNSFDALLGEPIEVSSIGAIPSGRKVWVRAAARINYSTINFKRWNYSEPIEVYIP